MDGKSIKRQNWERRKILKRDAESVKSPVEIRRDRIVRARKLIKMFRWSYGVTTVPSRVDDLLPRTLASLKEAGFDAPRLFVDGAKDATAYEKFGLEVTTRYPNVRTFGNWVLSLWELYLRDPDANLYAVFQDDFITYKNLRTYLEKLDYPGRGDDKGYWNLYTFPRNQKKCKAEPGWYVSDQLGKGAVALVFDRRAVQALLASSDMVGRPTNASRGWRAVDGGIVTALRKEGYTEYIHNPSLVQHVGDRSSMGNRKHQQATSFKGEDFDCLSLLK